jgi:2-amino-4-hydroxy-6-hydroxymethyldihydropteridine diphosphokinase
MSTHALIGLGSNLGDRTAHLEHAIEALRLAPGSQVLAVSSWHATSPAGGPRDQPEFLNAAVLLEVEIPPRTLLEYLLRIEAHEGRTRSVRWDARPLDLDLLLYGTRQVHEPDLTVPHPRMAVRRFVLAPAAEIAPQMVEPRTGRSVSDLLRNLDRRPGVLVLDRALDASAFQADASADWQILQAPEDPSKLPEPTFAVRPRDVRQCSSPWPARWPILDVDPSDPAWVGEVRASMQAARG